MPQEELLTLSRRVASLERTIFSPALDPAFLKVLLNQVGIRYTETEPTHTPNKEVEAWVWNDSGTYHLRIWANGGWRNWTAA